MPSTPAVERYDAHSTCPACGRTRRSLRDIWYSFWIGSVFEGYRVGFCEGGKEPTVEMPVQDAITGQTYGMVQGTCICYSIFHPHLHIVCMFCGHQRLMNTQLWKAQEIAKTKEAYGRAGIFYRTRG